MELDRVTWQGPPIDDHDILHYLPDDLRTLLEQINGYIQFSGGFHMRGASLAPAWHSLRTAWKGQTAFYHQYETVAEADIPFGQDALGDQYFLRDGKVLKLLAESDETEALELNVFDFLNSMQQDPVDFLALHPLLKYFESGKTLEPGELLSVYPPFVLAAENRERSYRAIPAWDRLSFLAELARQIRDVPDGTPIKFDIH